MVDRPATVCPTVDPNIILPSVLVPPPEAITCQLISSPARGVAAAGSVVGLVGWTAGVLVSVGVVLTGGCLLLSHGSFGGGPFVLIAFGGEHCHRESQTQHQRNECFNSHGLHLRSPALI
jgi:hypothetical protein